jgi:lysyl-tRNA synthetase class 1
LFKPDISENKEFDPSGNALIRLYDEYQNAANLSRRGKKLHRAEYKMALAYDLSTNIRRWRLDFSEILIYYQIYNDWNIVVEKLGDKEGVDYLKKYVENWIKDEFLPEKLVFKFQPIKIDLMNDEISVFANKLEESMNAEDIHKLVYSIAKEKRIKTSRFFKALYLTLISKDHGPRFGGLVTAVGIQRVKEMLQKLYSF